MIPIISGIISGATKLGSAWVESKTVTMKADAEYRSQRSKESNNWDLAALEASKTSWKDELISVVWFSPLVVAWFDQEKAQAWVDFIIQLPHEWWLITSGIIAAVFGLRWMFDRRATKIVSKDK